jgi:ATP-dependent DNA helicase RecG
MTVFGDLDVSTLRELPLGRQPITTHVVPVLEKPAFVERAWSRIKEEVAMGHQAYIVAPRISATSNEDADMDFLFGETTSDLASVEELAPKLHGGPLAGLRVAMLHGRMSADDKDSTMKAFASGEIDVLVSTTVIEVGVDVPNASVMVILDATRFGIAQLHQLRGRVGRGAAKSFCWLVGESKTPDGEARLEALVRSTDGFELAEVDLDLRGEGTIMGERQKGQNDLKLASLRRDREWVVTAREIAIEILDADPELVKHELLAEEVDLFLKADDIDFLMKS